jgi:trimeric autotransporter adhesin
MFVRSRSRSRLSALAFALAVSPAALAVPAPVWSGAFATGLTGTVSGSAKPARGACLLGFDTPAGPRLYVGGVFTTAGGLASPNLAAWDGRAWSAVTGAGGGGGGAVVNALTVFPVAGTPRVVAAGCFRQQATNDGLAFVNGSALAPMPAGPSSPFAEFYGAYAWTPPGGSPELVLSSRVSLPNSPNLYRLTATGYTGVAPGLVNVTSTFAEFDDGTGRALYIGGNAVNSLFIESACRWTGSQLAPLSVGTNFVTILHAFDDGSGPVLYGGGGETAIVRRLRPDGAWEDVPGSPGGILNSLESFDDGSGPALYLGGELFAPGSTDGTTGIYRFRAGIWEPVGSGIPGGEVFDLTVFDEDGPGPIRPALYATGMFTSAGGKPSQRIARWGVPPCAPDFDNSGTLSPADIFAFLTAYFARDASADFDRSGTFTPADIFGFLGAYFGGCPASV